MGFKNMYAELNSRQKKAVQIASGPSIILAGAGSGKTRVLVHKVLNLIQTHSVNPRSILMITFTNKAAKEMKDRIMQYLGTDLSIGFVGTFHSLSAMILRKDGEHIGIQRDFSIYDVDDQKSMYKNILKKMQSKYSVGFYSSRISEAKNQLITPDTFIPTYSYYKSAQVAEVYSLYQKELERNNALDFDDLLMKVVELFMNHPEIQKKYQRTYTFLLVDEFQDTNIAQYSLVKLLTGSDNNITVVGDFSQSIYSWRGADIRNLQKFSEDFPDAVVVNLEQNYRSTQPILDFAHKIILENQTHPILKLFTDKKAGEEVEIIETENEDGEAVYIANRITDIVQHSNYSDIAVLYRTNAQSRIIEEAFLHFGIPYMLIGGTRFYERKEIKDVISYLRLMIHPDDTVALERVKKLGKHRFQAFKTYHGEVASNVKSIPTSELLETILDKTAYTDYFDPDIPEEYARLENIKELQSVALQFPDLVQFLEQIALVESEYFSKEKSETSKFGVRLMTLHQAKGLEFEYVFITGVEEGLLPHSRAIDDLYQLEEERRLFYVGVTRAKEKLMITHAKRRSIFGKRSISVKSRFIRTGDEASSEWW